MNFWNEAELLYLLLKCNLNVTYCNEDLLITDTEVQNAIKWSEHLDPLFVNNYEMDPSLSWQYFGSSTGFLRRYPGK